MKKINIPLPPFAEQKRIVAKLDALMEKVDSCKERLEKIPDILIRFRQSVLAAAVSGRLTADWREKNPNVESAEELLRKILGNQSKISFNSSASKSSNNNWLDCKLGELCTLITKGASPKWQGINYVDSGVLFITSENVDSGKLLLDKRKYVETEFNKHQKRSILQKGDLLTNIVGASIGRTAIYDLDENANINQAVAILRLNNLLAKSFYLYTMNSDLIINQMHRDKVDVARANLSLADLNHFEVPLPPLAEQEEIVKRINGLFGFIDQVEARYETAKTPIDQLPQAILSKAFRGELVTQDPNDEPASVLLNRIPAEKTGKGKANKPVIQQELFSE